ncbi:MAG: nucleotidyl transferase AbiEii/AbiGii toxin family protein [Paludibacteraceae bacterium]|nr:nucleotidyl transferase AbiEii/AbiGii toxin family protein [Paludibacteraceae bacterium]
MWKDGLTQNTLEVFERISKLDFVKDFHLCGGTGIALQLNHRYSEDLDFELLTVQGKRDDLKELNHGQIIEELKSEFGKVEENGCVKAGKHFECYVGNHVKLSFFKPDYKVPELNEVSILNNLKTVSLQDALGMKLYVVSQRDKFRDYYDIYSLLKEGYSLEKGIQYAIKFSRHDVSSRSIISKLLAKEFFSATNKEGYFDFDDLKAKYKVDSSQICDFIEKKLSQVQISKIKKDTTVEKSVGRLFYETIIKLDDDRLQFVMGKLPEYDKLKSEDEKLNFLNNLLSSAGAKVAPYDNKDLDLLGIRKEKDVKSLSRIDEFLEEYRTYQKLASEIKDNDEMIKATKELQIDSSMKNKYINTYVSGNENLKKQQQMLRYFEVFEGVERGKEMEKKRPLDFSEGEDGAYESKGCKIK